MEKSSDLGLIGRFGYGAPMANPDKDAKAAIGRRVKERRDALGMTQDQLATKAELSKSFISEVENGATAASGLVYLRLAEALDVEVQFLLTGKARDEHSHAKRTPVVEPWLSNIADEQGWSHRMTLDVASATSAIIARRTKDGRRHELDRETVLRIAEALAAEDER